jgi:GNAT superfamily N-acetyltransferase
MNEYASGKALDIAVRQAVASDIPAIWDIRYAVTENTLAPGRISDEEVRQHLEDCGRGWVAEIDGKVQGFAIGHRESGNVWALFVHPRAQGCAVGTRLHDIMLAWFRDQPIATLWLDTGTQGRACAFYERNGWHVCHEHDGQRRYERDNCV